MRDGTGKLPTPDSQVDTGYGAKTMVYNMKGIKRRGRKKKMRKREVEEIQQ